MNATPAAFSEEVVRFSQRFKEARRTARLTQRQIKTLTGLSASYLVQIEAGRGNVSLDVASKLAEAVGVPLYRLIKP